MTNPASATEVTVVVPCLNEGGAIGDVVTRALRGLAKLGTPGEVLVIDNGSTDGSVQIAEGAGARVVSEPRLGYGNAVRRGAAEALGRYIVIADGDGSYPVEDLEPFVSPLRDGFGAVNGNRMGGHIAPDAMAWSHRYIGTPLLNLAVRLVANLHVHDSQCGMRSFRAEVLRSLGLRASGMEIASEMLVQAARRGVRIGEAEISFSPRVGHSKLRAIPDGWRHLRYLLAASPDHLFVLPGACLVLLSLLLLVTFTLAPGGIGIAGTDWKPRFAALMAATLGVQVLWCGILTKIVFVSSGILTTDRLADWYLRQVTLERSLALALALGLAGLLIEVVVAGAQLGVLEIPPGLDLGLIGAVMVIVGAQSLFGAFLAYCITSELGRPSDGPTLRA